MQIILCVGLPLVIILALLALAAIIGALIALFDSGATGTVSLPQQIQDEIRATYATLDEPSAEDLCKKLDAHKSNLENYLNSFTSLTDAQKQIIRDALSAVNSARTLANC